jgi:hypothetical protein
VRCNVGCLGADIGSALWPTDRPACQSGQRIALTGVHHQLTVTPHTQPDEGRLKFYEATVLNPALMWLLAFEN